MDVGIVDKPCLLEAGRLPFRPPDYGPSHIDLGRDDRFAWIDEFIL